MKSLKYRPIGKSNILLISDGLINETDAYSSRAYYSMFPSGVIKFIEQIDNLSSQDINISYDIWVNYFQKYVAINYYRVVWEIRTDETSHILFSIAFDQAGRVIKGSYKDKSSNKNTGHIDYRKTKDSPFISRS